MGARFYDTLMWEYIKNPGIRWLSLDKLSQKEFQYRMISYDEITNKKKVNFVDVDLKAAAIYSGEDVYITNKLYNKQLEEKTTENKVLNEIEIPLIEVLKEMEISWVYVERDKLKWIALLLDQEIERLEKSIYAKVGEEFNIKSPKQVWNILFEKLALPKWKKTKTGYSVSAEVLWELAHEYPIAQEIVDYRHYTKLKSTYIEWLLDLIDDNSLVHTSYNASVTSTGRLSSTSPNLQNIPSSNWIAWEIRGAFISRFDNWKIIALDYSQVEVRILAIMSEDENLLSAFKNWLDIHHKTAEFLFPNSTITNSERKIAKAVNFWVIYWISWFWLAKMIWISMKDAKIYIEKFYESYPKVKLYLEKTIASCEEKKYVETMFWRKRYINGINDLNKIVKSSAEREATNMPIQWTSADIIKIAMIQVHKYMLNHKLKSKMIMQVHDELVFDVFPWEEVELKREVQKIMQNIIKDSQIELKVDIWEWNTWKEAK